jgi:hypothetical protein
VADKAGTFKRRAACQAPNLPVRVTILMVIWLGDKRGYLSDWLTQLWVRATGRRLQLTDNEWIDGPTGKPGLIGKDFFADYANQRGLEVVRNGSQGLIENFGDLSANGDDLEAVAVAVKDFYERTAEYELDAWSEWRGIFKVFGNGLAVLFSRRLQQLNVPLSSLDTGRGITSDVIKLRDPVSGRIVQTAWVRELVGTKNVLYAGSYTVCRVPGWPGPCIKVVFPLPNGNAIVIMKPEAHADGSLSVTSSGRAFGDPGFYFVVHGGGDLAWVRYLPSLKESIRVFAAESNTVRADHLLWIWGIQFLRLHYRMRSRQSVPSQAAN